MPKIDDYYRQIAKQVATLPEDLRESKIIFELWTAFRAGMNLSTAFDDILCAVTTGVYANREPAEVIAADLIEGAEAVFNARNEWLKKREESLGQSGMANQSTSSGDN